MGVREVYEFVTDSLVSFEKRRLTTRALRGIGHAVATVIPIEKRAPVARILDRHTV